MKFITKVNQALQRIVNRYADNHRYVDYIQSCKTAVVQFTQAQSAESKREARENILNVFGPNLV